MNGYQPHSGSDSFARAMEGWDKFLRDDSLGELLREWALYYSQVLGWRVFPLAAFRKVPATEHGFLEATIAEKRVRKWWDGRTRYNVGIATGCPGPDVLDVEGRLKPGGSGWAAYYQLKDAGMLTGAFRLVGTPSEGAHLYYAGTEQKSGALRKLHIEVKAQGGYVAAPPSVVSGGTQYRIIDDRPPTGATFSWETAKRLLSPPKPVPARRVSRHGHGNVRHLVKWFEKQGTGNRNSALFWAACRAAETGDEQVLLDLVEAGVQAGLERDEAHRTVVSAARKVTGDGR